MFQACDSSYDNQQQSTGYETHYLLIASDQPKAAAAHAVPMDLNAMLPSKKDLEKLGAAGTGKAAIREVVDDSAKEEAKPKDDDEIVGGWRQRRDAELKAEQTEDEKGAKQEKRNAREKAEAAPKDEPVPSIVPTKGGAKGRAAKGSGAAPPGGSGARCSRGASAAAAC